MHRTGWPRGVVLAGLFAWGLWGCHPDGLEDHEGPSVDSKASEIKNGTIWDPWSTSIHSWTRNVVRITAPKICTGTLINREWVLSAGHCFDASTPASSVTVDHTGPGGVRTVTRGVELFRYPSLHGRAQDVALIRIEEPIDTGVGDLHFFSGTTQSLVGKKILCAGYGRIDTNGPLSNTLRIAWMDVIADTVNTDYWYQFDVPNSSGQILLPGDSGSTCMGPDGLTGVHKAGNDVDYNRQTSAAIFRDWVNGIVWPRRLAQSNYPGAACTSMGTALAAPDANGELHNRLFFTRTFVCPIERDEDASGTFSNVIRAPRVFVRDQHPSQNVCCALQTKNPTGRVQESTTICSQGHSSGYQSLNIPTVYDKYSWSQVSLRCTVPGLHGSAASGVMTYRTLQAIRQ